jgi:hypothetical protein
MQSTVANQLENNIKNPGDVFAPERIAATGNVDKSYQSLDDRLSSNFAGRGFGQSGKVLTNAEQLETSRAGDIGSLDAQFAGMQNDYETQMLQMGEQYGFASPGSTQTQPGGVAGGAVSGGLSTLTTLLSLNGLLGGGGGGGGSWGGGGGGWVTPGIS